MNILRLFCLILPVMSLADLGDMPLVSTMNVSTDTTNIFEAGTGAFSSPIFTLSIENNNLYGYTIYAQSANGSQFNLDIPAFDTNKDGHTLQYQFSCTDVTLEDSSVRASEGLQTLSSASPGTTVLDVTNPSAATASQDVNCTLHLIGGENVTELLSGTFEDTITITSEDATGP